MGETSHTLQLLSLTGKLDYPTGRRGQNPLLRAFVWTYGILCIAVTQDANVKPRIHVPSTNNFIKAIGAVLNLSISVSRSGRESILSFERRLGSTFKKAALLPVLHVMRPHVFANRIISCTNLRLHLPRN